MDPTKAFRLGSKASEGNESELFCSFERASDLWSTTLDMFACLSTTLVHFLNEQVTYYLYFCKIKLGLISSEIICQDQYVS